MTFLNIAMIGGVLALTIPILIHLLNRNRPRVVKWGAMHLLEQVVRTQRKRLRIEQILLLLVRAMIPVLLAICMASPVLTGCKELAGSSRSSMVVILDNSYSMSVGGANSSHARATTAAIEALRALRDGSDASVVLMAGGAGPILDEPTMRMSLLTEELQKRTASYGKAEVASSFDAALGILNQMNQPRRDLLVITDFQRVSWDPPRETLSASIAQWRASQPLGASLILMHIGQEVTDNLAMTDVSLSKSIIGIGQRVTVRGNLRNVGSKAYTSLRVYFDVNQERRGVSEISIGPGEEAQVIFTHEFQEAGSHVIRLFADGDSTLKEDNEIQAVVRVLERVPVLLIDGDPAPAGEPLQGETGFLAAALEPFAQSKADTADLLEVKVTTAAGFSPDLLDDVKVIVLANVRSLDDDQLRMLDGFVRGGGGLLIFPGNRVSSDWFNDKLHAEGAGLAPASLAALSGSLTDATRHTRIAVQQYTHPALTLFNDRRSGNLASADIRSWFTLHTPTTATGVSTVARLENGDPLLIEKRHGQGTILLCATACDGDWSSLPTRSFYVPLMQQLVSHAASSVEPSHNVQVGQPLVALLPRALIGRRAMLTDPSGRRYSMTVIDQATRGLIEHRSTDMLGLYTLDFPGSDARPIHFVVGSPREESDLRQLSRDEIAELAGAVNADLVSSIDDLHALDQTRRHGSEIWHWFFWAVLLMCFVELFLQYRFSSRGTASS